MEILPTTGRWSQIILVVSGFLFIGFIIILAKVVGDGCLVPIVFIIGWIIFLSIFLARFQRFRRKNRD
jgi:thiol:disulfide interchange protein